MADEVPAGDEPRLIDTMLAGAKIVGAGKPGARELLERYRNELTGRPLVIAFVTVAELRYGAYKDGWGHARIAKMEQWFRRVTVAPVDDSLVDTYAGSGTRAWSTVTPSTTRSTTPIAGSPPPRSATT